MARTRATVSCSLLLKAPKRSPPVLKGKREVTLKMIVRCDGPSLFPDWLALKRLFYFKKATVIKF